MWRDDVQHLWTPSDATPDLSVGEVHVWSASLIVSDLQLARFRAVLSHDEIARSECSPLLDVRNRFIVGRGLLRQVLAAYVQIEPSAIQFAYGHAGKPHLVDNAHDIQFNISHSGDLAVIAISRTHEIGVDIERICDMPEMPEIVSRFFSDDAKAEFQSAPIEDRVSVFFKCWTEREAISKCTGDGIAEDKPVPTKGITVIPLSPAIGYVGSLAVRGPSLKVQTWHWEHSRLSVDTERFTAAASGVFL